MAQRAVRTDLRHVCETGGGTADVVARTGECKAHVLRCVTLNLGLLLRKVFGLGQAAEQRGPGGGFMLCADVPPLRLRAETALGAVGAFFRAPELPPRARARNPETGRLLTGC